MRIRGLPGIRTVVFDLGETLVDESRCWAAAARTVGTSPFTLMAHLGSLIERGLDHRAVWAEIGVEPPAMRERIGTDDLYPDALPCLRHAKACGFTIGIAGNQPEAAVDELAALGFDADFIASSGDRIDNDAEPARRAGMRAAHLMRAPPSAHTTTGEGRISPPPRPSCALRARLSGPSHATQCAWMPRSCSYTRPMRPTRTMTPPNGKIHQPTATARKQIAPPAARTIGHQLHGV